MNNLAYLFENLPEVELVSDEEREQKDIDWKNSRPGNLEGYDCEVCLNRGYVYMLGNTSKTCECMKTRRSLKLITASGLEPLMKRYTFDSFTTGVKWQAAIKAAALDFLKDDAACFFAILGQTGAGKTHICTAMAADYLRKHIPVYYMLWLSDIKKLRATVTEGEIHEKEIKRLQTIEVLYLDDLFKCKRGFQPSDADVRLAFEIINARYNAQRTTLISSEFTINELKQIDPATAGRIKELCGSYMLNIERNESRNYRWI